MWRGGGKMWWREGEVDGGELGEKGMEEVEGGLLGGNPWKIFEKFL